MAFASSFRGCRNAASPGWSGAPPIPSGGEHANLLRERNISASERPAEPAVFTEHLEQQVSGKSETAPHGSRSSAMPTTTERRTVLTTAYGLPKMRARFGIYLLRTNAASAPRRRPRPVRRNALKCHRKYCSTCVLPGNVTQPIFGRMPRFSVCCFSFSRRPISAPNHITMQNSDPAARCESAQDHYISKTKR